MKKVKIAIIGCGAIANSAHIPAYKKHDGVELAWLCDILPERAKKAAEECGRQYTTDYKELLNRDDIDAVSICTPNNVHAPIAIDFLRAGKDVLCEKPAARTYAEALEMQKAQKETGRILSIGVCNRFNTSVMKIKDRIDAGELGDIFHVYISFRSHRSIPGLGGAFTTNAIAGGGSLIDWGVHFIDLVMYCCGDPAPLTVSGEAFCRLGRDMKNYAYKDMWAGPPDYDGVYDVDDSVTALVRTAGPVMTVHGAWAQNIGEDAMYIDFMGDKGGIRLQYGGGFTQYTSRGGELLTIKPEYPVTNHYENEIASFIASIHDRQPTTASIDNAIITSRIMEAIYDSSAAHREIVL
ncbi:MAG: Gfo/Idh/MocA family oxidoreductase [Oscillospiraceae bacterium]|jgi:predicted dehydrogenase|nr:Gfo/Idh/MocA family oxidoreductase [Oscillospiraceae bacterium]